MGPMHERISASALCFLGRPLPDVADAWRQLQPRRVSFTSLILDDPAAARAVVDEGGYRVETIAYGFLAGQLDDEPSWEEPRARLSATIAAAQLLGARSIYLLTGGHGSLTWEEAAARFSAAVEPCVREAQAAGIALMIETASPMRADMHIAHSLRDTITLAEQAGLGVCLDLFSCWAEAGLKASIERAMPHCHLIQIGDYVYGDRCLPGRAVPGDGVIPIREILDWALSAGYAEGFDLEILGPRIDAEGPVAATRRAAEHVGAILEGLGV
jgi:sugar phosphate isomerase/epimerase